VEVYMDVLRRFGKRIYKGTKSSVAWVTLLDRGWEQIMYLKKKKEEQLERGAGAEFRIPEVPF
jgi:hypothetical protein